MLCSFAISQSYHKFIEGNKKWWINYTCDNQGGCNKQFDKGLLYYFEGDTIINSISYSILKSKVVWSSLIPIGTTNNVGYYREDSVNQKVYIYYFGNSINKINNREVLLFDYNLKVGDSFNSINRCSDAMNSLTLTKIDTISTTNVNLRKFTFNDNSSYMESIGSINPGFVVTDTFSVCIADYQNPVIQCVKENNTVLYGNNCDNTSLKSQTMKFNVDISPTIMIDKLYVKTNCDSFANIIIYSINGCNIISKKLDSNNNEITVTELTKGMYYYVLSDNSGIIKTGKLIKN